MTTLRFQDHARHLAQIRAAALAAADPARAIAKHLRLKGSELRVGSRSIQLVARSRIFLIAIGKASPAMVLAASERLAARLLQGVAAVPHHHQGSPPPGMVFLPAGHPLPDQGSLQAGEAIADLLAGIRPEDLVLLLISGGGSAMAELPRPGVELEHLRSLNSGLIRSGASIDEVNVVRSALSLLKGGGLARLAAPAQVVALILSDVVGNRLASIASGPSVLRAPRPAAAREVLQRYGLWDGAPPPVGRVLSQDPPARPSARRPLNLIIASLAQVLEAAQARAESLGFPTRVLSRQMQGEARLVAARLASRLRRVARPACLLMGGETTVTVTGSGKGGRNQEFALAAAIALHAVPDVTLMSLATDGIDGPTDAAGALVSGETAEQARRAGYDPQRYLQENNSYPLLHATGSLIVSGPTGTNLNDLVVALAYPGARS